MLLWRDLEKFALNNVEAVMKEGSKELQDKSIKM